MSTRRLNREPEPERPQVPSTSESSLTNNTDSHTIDTRKAAREARLAFPPVYVFVGAYRLLADPNLRVPAWQKCKHGAVRGAIVGLAWAAVSYKVQKVFVEMFLRNSPRVTGLSHDAIFGYQLPFTVTTYATLLFLTDQITFILRFFLAKNIRIARDRAWDQTVLSRAKSRSVTTAAMTAEGFWGPYVEEWAVPPRIVDVSSSRPQGLEWVLGSYLGRMVVQRVVMLPLAFYPFVGIAVGAGLKALGTARYLHKQYFAEKKMTEGEVAVFVEERKWHYRAFGFAAALLERIPIVGLVFTVSNRVGAAMWAHDLEKRQHAFAAGEVAPTEHSPGYARAQVKM